MKKIICLLLIIVSVFFVVPRPIIATPTKNADLVNAQDSALTFTRIIAERNFELAYWVDTKVSCSQVLYNLEGEINAYLFTIMDEEPCGFVLVGSNDYEYRVFQAGTSLPPSIPEITEVVDSASQLGIAIDLTTKPQPIEIICTGIDGIFAVYEIYGQLLAFNMITKEIVPKNRLLSTMPNPTDFKIRRSLIDLDRHYALTSSGYYYLSMSAYSGGYCGPCSGVSIGAYYRDYKGYSSLYTNSYMYTTLYSTMYCSYYGGATMPSDYGPGFLAMTQYCGYNNFSIVNDWYVTQGDYWSITSNIDSGWPTALCITSDWHWRAIKGYDWVGTPWNWYYIICTNSATNDSWEYLDWDYLGVGLFTCCVKN